jgi:hypothetical protein
LLIVVAAGWLVARDYQVMVQDAELHLDNFAVVLAEQTRIALGNADPALRERISGRARADAGAAEAHVNRFFTDLYGGLELGYEGRVLVFREDGVLVTAVPWSDHAGARDFAAHPLFAQASRSKAAGAVRAPGFIEGGDRLIAYRKVKEQPLLVAVSTPMSEVLAPWRRDAAIMAAAALLLAALFAGASVLLGRQLRVTGTLAQEAADNESRLNSIIGSAMDAIITVDEDQKIVLFNAAAEKIFRCAAQEAVGSPLERFIPERFREAHHEHVRRFGEAGVTTRRMGARTVLSGLRTTGEEFPIDASISHATVAGRKFYTVILRDVTERQDALERQQAAQRQLEESERRLQSIIGSAMDAIITLDEQQNVVLFNAAAERIFGCRAREAVGAPIERFIPERYRATHREHVRRFGEAGVTMRRMGGNLVLAGLRENGEEFPIDASISHATVSGHKFYTVILRDVTARQRSAEALDRSHRELRELYESMHHVREAERTRIARELHDELAQWLTALKMDASWIATRLPRENEPLVRKAEAMKAVVDSTVAAVRRIAADLRPVMLDDLGFVPALENLVSDLSGRTGIEVTLDTGGGDLDLREPLATALYRMVQEALTNVARHAKAVSADVELRADGTRLHVRVSDDGEGYNPDAGRKSYGVLGIRERARTLGGEARIYSPPEGGTVVEIDVPLQTRPMAGTPT